MPDKNFSLLNIKLEDQKGMSKALRKLLDTVARAAGAWFEPKRIVRRAKAEAEASIIKLKSEIKATGVAHRASQRLQNQELRRQRNIETIVEGAARALSETVSQEKVDEDWTAQFFNYCQDVGNEEMQSLWSKILAGQVTKPGSYSLRTLDHVRKLSKDDAAAFTCFCNFVWRLGDSAGGYSCCHICPSQPWYETPGGIDFDIVLHLDSLSLIKFIPELTLRFTTEGPEEISYYGARYMVWPFVSINVIPLSRVGEELFPICGSKANNEYLSEILNLWKEKGATFKKMNLQRSSIPSR